MGILKEFAVNAKTDEQAWNELEVHKHVCSIGNTYFALMRHGFIKFNDEGFELKTKGIKNE